MYIVVFKKSIKGNFNVYINYKYIEKGRLGYLT